MPNAPRLTHPASSYWVLPRASRINVLGNAGADGFCDDPGAASGELSCGSCVAGVWVVVAEVFGGATGRRTSVKINL